MYPSVTRLARILGPKGLMPTTKKGTVTEDISGVIKAQTAAFDIRGDKNGVVHTSTYSSFLFFDALICFGGVFVPTLLTLAFFFFLTFISTSHWKGQLGSEGYRRKLPDHFGADEGPRRRALRQEGYVSLPVFFRWIFSTFNLGTCVHELTSMFLSVMHNRLGQERLHFIDTRTRHPID